MEHPPPAGTAAASIERAADFHSEHGCRTLMLGRWAWHRDELTVDDLSRPVVGDGEEILVGRAAPSGCDHGNMVPQPRVRRRGGA